VEQVTVRPSGTRFATRTDGILSEHSFSFGEHYDPDDVGWGPLLVSNEDVLAVGAGYGSHSHRDAEIVTWVLSGTLVHEDSAGNRGLVVPGLAQRMSAGSGIVHSERNDTFALVPGQEPEPTHFVQMWLRPDTSGGTPGYAQRALELAELDRGWVPVAAGRGSEAAVSLGTRDATLWVTRLAPSTGRNLPDAGRLHLQVVRGAVELERAGPLLAGDTVRVLGCGGQRVTASRPAELLVWTLPR
jgi:redox-sensitive bicupin YhaK (pirin superfamily)